MIEMVIEKPKGPRILVVGVGGAGTNAVDNMALSGLAHVDFLVMNTDAQALERSKTENQLHIGKDVTKGLGTGANPLLGEKAALEDRDRILEAIDGTDLMFITAGLGGGTGTGASPVLAELAKEIGALTVAIVTKPFDFEGAIRRRHAERGQVELRQRTDTLITIPNQRLLKVIDEQTSLLDAFKVSDAVLMQCVQSISDLITQPGVINLDFADIKAIMDSTGGAVMGVGFGRGDGKAETAFAQASSSPLMEEVVLEGARGILVNITGGPDMTLHEINNAIEKYINAKADADANIIFGVVIDEKMAEEMKVTVLATGYEKAPSDSEGREQPEPRQKPREDMVDFEQPTFLKSGGGMLALREQDEESFDEEEEPIVLKQREDKDVLPAIFGP